MKKTEKIEIRVTPEEKEGLMDLAHSEGRSLSDFIRSILGSYAQTQKLQATKTDKRIIQMFKSKKTWSIGGIISSAIAFTLLGAPAQADGAYKVTMNITDQVGMSGETVSHNWSKELQSMSAKVQHFVVTSKSGTRYEFTIMLQEMEEDTVFAEFNICKRDTSNCEPVAKPSLVFTKSEPTEIVIGSATMTTDGEIEKMIDGFTIQIAHSTPKL